MNQGGMKQGGMSGQNAQSERQTGATGTGGMANGGKSPSMSSDRSAQEFNKNNKGAGTNDRTAQQRSERGQPNAHKDKPEDHTVQERRGEWPIRGAAGEPEPARRSYRAAQ